jgi:cell division inhibitor SepF
MATLLNKVLNFVGWESEEDEEIVFEEEETESFQDKFYPMQLQQGISKKQSSNKIVNIHSNSQVKVVITQPESIEEARSICDHLRDKKPVVVNLEDLNKEAAQRIIDFLSGSVYAVDGCMQRISAGIFLAAPNNVDVMGGNREGAAEDLKNKTVFPRLKNTL